MHQRLGGRQMQLDAAFQAERAGVINARREHQHAAARFAQRINRRLQPFGLQVLRIRHGFQSVWPNARQAESSAANQGYAA